MLVLGIESSCDETGVALYDTDKGLIAENLYSQAELHSEYGGVVPELASRDHIRKLTPIIQQTLAESKIEPNQINAIAYTKGPGLMGALLVGGAVARSLAFAWGIPAIGVHHMEGHIFSAMLEDKKPDFPFICLLISGGHTMLVKVEALGKYEILGDTLDDAVGEAFDKTAKVLGLGYPGGPEVSRLALEGNSDRFKFPLPMVNRPGMDMSFSGLKTFALNTWLKNKSDANIRQTQADICRAFELSVAKTLAIKCKRSLIATGYSRLVIAGGVSANKEIRLHLQQLIKNIRGELFCPRLEYCTDNGAMIALAGAQRLMMQQADGLSFAANPRWNLSQLNEKQERKLLL